MILKNNSKNMGVFKRLCANYLAYNCPIGYFRRKFLNMAGISIPSTTRINEKVFFSTNQVHIGDNCFVNRYVMFDDGLRGGKIVLESNVYIGMRTLFCAVSHEIGETNCRAGKAYARDIFVGKGTWIGANVTILPNVKIGRGCVIAAGAVVANDCDDNCLYAGVPAKIVRKL